MKTLSIDLARLELALHGVSAATAEAAVAGLEEALRRRLAARPAGEIATSDAAELALGPVGGGATLDAAALRGVIADRLADALFTGGRGGSSGGGGS